MEETVKQLVEQVARLETINLVQSIALCFTSLAVFVHIILGNHND